MSHFYATIPVSARKTVPTACGHKFTGINTVAASWAGSIRVRLWHDEDTGLNMFEVTQAPWHGHGVSHCIAHGVVGETVDRTGQPQDMITRPDLPDARHPDDRPGA